MDSRLWRRYDWWLLGSVIVLIVMGIAMIYSAAKGDPVIARSWLDQAVTAVAGLFILILISVLDYTLLKNVSPVLYIVTLAMLVLVLVPGIGKLQNGARRWFDLGIFDLQPGEVAKLVLAIVVAKVIADGEGRRSYLATIFITFLLVAPGVALILLQPNLSTAVTILFMWMVMVFTGGIGRKHFLIISVVFVVIVLIVTQLPSFRDYQLRRIELLLGLVEEQGANYQSEQALNALGNGGLFGRGWGQGLQTQLRLFPVRHTDFIFSVIGEELGFVGAMIFIALLVFIMLRALRVAMISRDTFGRLLCVGIASTLFLQTYINLGMQVKLMPVTGVVLPFVSYGRSSLISVMLAIGIIESVAMRYKKLEF